jgi:REP element-mobilizing transposase RayT
MPNHFHGILIITGDCEGGSRTAPTRKPVGRLVGVFKTVTTKRFNEARNSPGEKLWQRNYYEHIILDDNDYLRLAEYIQSNPMNWENDQLWAN